MKDKDWCDTCKEPWASERCNTCKYGYGKENNYKPMTNADSIRGMTDAEIANVLYWSDGQGYSRRQWIMWLKAPVEVQDG